MSFQKIADEQIAEAIARGEFDNLPGAGRPLNLDDYFSTREDLRMGLGMLKSNGFIPAEIELLKEIRALEEQVAEWPGKPDEVARLRRELEEKTVRFNMMMENLK